VTVSAAPAADWVFVGWLGTGPGAYAGPNATTSVSVVGPINETAEFDLRFTVGVTGSGSLQATFGSSSYSIGGNPLTFYVAPGTKVTLVAQPGPLATFVGWRGIPAGSSGGVVVFPTAPHAVTAIFGVNKVLSYGLVVLYWGVAVFMVFYLLRYRHLSLGRFRISGGAPARHV
jgi:hypothetical protein